MWVVSELFRNIFRAVTSREPSVEVATSRINGLNAKSALVNGMKVTATLLSGFFIAFTTPQVTMTVSTQIITGIHRSDLVTSNFITLDDKYIILSDGRIFFVLED